jgi:uncharacterized protein YbaR (Trm112 family)
MRQSFVSSALLEALVCPVCYQKLEHGPQGSSQIPHSHNAADRTGMQEWLHCLGCGRCYPIVDGLAVMREERATATPPNT